MRSLVYQGPRVLTMEERAYPQPEAGEALLRVKAVGICGSELEGYLGLSSIRKPPLVMGHEFSGEIVALNAGDVPISPTVGQLVTANPFITCGVCRFCTTGYAHVCPQRQLIGAHRAGAFAEYVTVPITCLIPLPATVDAVRGALTEPFAVAIHGVELAQLTPDHHVVVWGAGSIGLLAICAAKLAQPAQIIAIDTNETRLEAALAMGATTALNAREGDTVARVNGLLSPASRVAVLDAVGRSLTRQAALDVAGPGGSVILLGLHDRETTFDVSNVIRSEVKLQGSYAYTMDDVHRAVALLAEGYVPIAPWMEIRDLAQGADSFAELVDRPGAITKILLTP